MYPNDAVYILTVLQAFLPKELHAILTELQAIMIEDYRQT
jgi:hypothetical protein